MEHQELTGQVLDGRYRVIGPVGKGAMGSVYRAEDIKLRRTVAVKVMNEHVPKEMSSRRRFDREATAMAKLEHPHTASILDVGMHGDQPYVVMEFITGQSLDALVAEGPMPMPRAVEITRQVLFGLSHAHEHGIIHRDIKPANIVLSQKSSVGDHVKILDFGLAKLSQETSNITIGLIVGTPSYMAPEQIRGLALDGRADIYACGVLLYELLTGVKPFRAATNDPLAICMAHLNNPVPRLADARPGHDFGPLEDVIVHALAKDRDNRFRTAGAFANALVAAMAAQPGAPTATPPAGLPRAPTPLPVRPSAPRVEPLGATVSLADVDLLPAQTAAKLEQAPAPSRPSPSSRPPTDSSAAVTAHRRPVPRRRRLAIGGVILAVAAAAAAAVLIMSRGGDDPPATPATPSAGSASGAEPSPPPETPPPSNSQDPVADLLAQAEGMVAARRHEAAINLLVKARRIYPRDARLPYQAGLLYMGKMFRTDGLKQLRAAIELDPAYKTDRKLIESVVRVFNSTSSHDWTLASFLRNDIGEAAKPVLEEVAQKHSNPIVRTRAKAELRHY